MHERDGHTHRQTHTDTAWRHRPRLHSIARQISFCWSRVSNNPLSLTLYGNIKTAEQRTIITAIRWLVNWPLMGELLHLVQRGGGWAGWGPAQSPPRCTKCNSPPINVHCSNCISFGVALQLPLHSKGIISIHSPKSGSIGNKCNYKWTQEHRYCDKKLTRLLFDSGVIPSVVNAMDDDC